MGSGQKKKAWKTPAKYMSAENRTRFEEVWNQQLERKDDGQKTIERNM